MQQIAKDVKPEKLQVISFQLGEVLTESAKRHGYIKDTIEWYDGKIYRGAKPATLVL